MKYFNIWFLMVINSFQTSFASRAGAILFITGKVIRFFFFLILLVLVVQKTKILGGYNLSQIVFFFLTFNLVDITSQLLFREVYRFRPLVVSGNLDLVLVKPVNPLLRLLLGGTDALDAITLVPLVGFMIFWATQFNASLLSVILYILLILNSLLIAAALHIVVLGVGVLTTAVDHTIMIYRDLASMGKIPVDFYNDFIRGLLTFVVPISIMMTIPAKAFLNLISPKVIVFSLLAGVLLLWLSLVFWNWSLKHYSSAGG